MHKHSTVTSDSSIPRRPSEPSLRGRVIRGARWALCSKAVLQLLDLCKVLILARLLSPGDFGLFGIAMLAIMALEVFSQTGFNAALIQLEEGSESYLDTAWTIACIRGCLIAAVMFGVAPLVGIFFREPQAVPLLRFLCLAPIFNGFSNIGVIYFQKELQFKCQFAYEVSAAVVSLVVGVTLAIITRSVWSLVWANLAASVARCAASYYLHSFRPRPRLDLTHAARLFRFGKWIFGQSILLFIWQQGDRAVLARLLTSAALGAYQLAFRIAMLPIIQLSLVVTTVMFPAYAKLQHERQRVAAAFLNVLESVMLLVIPASVFIGLCAHDVVYVVLGEQWGAAVAPLRWLAVFAAIKALGDVSGPLYLGIGQPHLETWRNLLQVLGLGLCIVPLTQRFGIAGTSAAAVMGVIATLPIFLLVFKKVGLSLQAFGMRLAPAFLLGLLVGCSCLSVQCLIRTSTPLRLIFESVLSSLTCLIALGVLLRFVPRDPYVSGRNILRNGALLIAAAGRRKGTM